MNVDRKIIDYVADLSRLRSERRGRGTRRKRFGQRVDPY